jgi:hypothetical protein
VVLQHAVQLSAGEQRLTLDVSRLPAGVYSLQLQGQDILLSKLFVKQ